MMPSSSEITAVTHAKFSGMEQKDRSRGVSVDMSSKAVTARIDIVDELRELAEELANAKRLGPLNSDHQPSG
ncbi:MAG: hypothetical protein ACK480_13780 [Planctomycetota bacterium]|jgi:hypothetical protein